MKLFVFLWLHRHELFDEARWSDYSLRPARPRGQWRLAGHPAIYAAARTDRNSFTQLNMAGTTNDNIFYTGNPGQLHNQGIGLGLPDLVKLAGSSSPLSAGRTA